MLSLNVDHIKRRKASEKEEGKKGYVRPTGVIRPSEKSLSLVFSHLKDKGPLSRLELALLTGLSKGFMLNCTRFLIEDGEIVSSHARGMGTGKAVKFKVKE